MTSGVLPHRRGCPGRMTVMESDRQRLVALYRRYNQCCNAHRFSELGEFVDDNVEVNGAAKSLDQYIAGLYTLDEAFPDYQWGLRHLLVDNDWLSAHFVDTGTHTGAFLGVPATGRGVIIHEFAIYRIRDDKIIEVWGSAADNASLLAQLTVPGNSPAPPR
jgi:predicted ester cyclase